MITIPVGVDSDGRCFPRLRLPACTHRASNVSTHATDTEHMIGVPFGLGIIHKPNREEMLIKFGSAIEELIGGRPIPRFLNPDAVGYLYTGSKPDGQVRKEGVR